MIAAFIIATLIAFTIARLAHGPIGSLLTPRAFNRYADGTFRPMAVGCYPYAMPIAFHVSDLWSTVRALAHLARHGRPVEPRTFKRGDLVTVFGCEIFEVLREATPVLNSGDRMCARRQGSLSAFIHDPAMFRHATQSEIARGKVRQWCNVARSHVLSTIDRVRTIARSIVAIVRHGIAYRVALLRSLPLHARYTFETITEHVYDLNPTDTSGMDWIVPVEKVTTIAHARPWFRTWRHLRSFHAGKLQIAGAFLLGLAIGAIGGCEVDTLATVAPFVFWRGLSEYDGKPIVAIAGDTGNRKTDRTYGIVIVSERFFQAMRKAYAHVSRRNVAGLQAFKANGSGCSDACSHKIEGSCYVAHNVQSIGQPGAMCAHAIDMAGTLGDTLGASLWGVEKYREGLQGTKAKIVRSCVLGSLGSLPIELREGIQRENLAWASADKDRTSIGYLEEMDQAPDLAPSHMASALTIEAAERHLSKGRRVFASLDPMTMPRVNGSAGPGIEIPSWARLCPASKEWGVARGGEVVTCSDCKACDGNGYDPNWDQDGTEGETRIRRSRVIMRHDIKTRARSLRAMAGMAIYDDKGRHVGSFSTPKARVKR